MKKIISSKNFSLESAIFNGVFSLYSVLNGGIVVGLICAGFCTVCMANYLRAQ